MLLPEGVAHLATLQHNQRQRGSYNQNWFSAFQAEAGALLWLQRRRRGVLSDHEQNLLEQMERALYAEDPKFADSLRKSRRGGMNRKRFLLGVGGVIVGLAVLVGGVATQIIPLGLIGFFTMLAGAFLCYRSFGKGEEAEAEGSGEAAKPTAPSGGGKDSGGFMDRLEERWQQRKDRGQY